METQKNNKPITPAQLKKIQTMFSKIGFDQEEKQNIISQLTQKRTISTRDLSCSEARYLISYLNGETLQNEVYRKECISILSSIYRLSCDIGMCYGDTQEDKLMNYAKINQFCRERGTVKKNVTEMSLPELKKTKRQFEAMLKNNIESAVKKLINKSLYSKSISK